MTPERIRERAEREFAAVRAEMIRIAREIAPAWLGDAPVPTTTPTVVRAVLDAIAVEHPERDELLDFCRAELGRIEAFCREHDLIGLADEPLEIGWTPVFLRAFGGAMLELAGSARARPEGDLLDHADPRRLDRRSRPSPTLREDNARMLRLLDDPRGGARPLPPGRLRATAARRSPGRSSGAASSPRAGRST